MAKQYWMSKGKWGQVRPSAQLELRGSTAYDLIKSWGAVAGKAGEEDRSGRAKLDLQTPEELVDRCFKIADLVIDKLEARGEIRELLNDDEAV